MSSGGSSKRNGDRQWGPTIPENAPDELVLETAKDFCMLSKMKPSDRGRVLRLATRIRVAAGQYPVDIDGYLRYYFMFVAPIRSHEHINHTCSRIISAGQDRETLVSLLSSIPRTVSACGRPFTAENSVAYSCEDCGVDDTW